jgi:hypothetical protein
MRTQGRLLRFPEPAVRAHLERAEAAAIAFANSERKPMLLRSLGVFLALGAATLTTASLLAAVALAATHFH